jgi:SulP family sulfate permease
VLSAVVFLIGVDLVDLRGMRRIYDERRPEFWIALITMLMVVFVGVEQGIMLAIVLSLIEHTRRGYRPKNVVLSPGDSGAWTASPVASAVQAAPGLIVYRFTHSMYYANSQQLSDEITTLVNKAVPPIRWFCIDASAVDDVDFTAAETLRALHDFLKSRGVRLMAAEVSDELAAESRYHLQELFGRDAFFRTLHEVLEAYRQRPGAVQD